MFKPTKSVKFVAITKFIKTLLAKVLIFGWIMIDVGQNLFSQHRGLVALAKQFLAGPGLNPAPIRPNAEYGQTADGCRLDCNPRRSKIHSLASRPAILTKQIPVEFSRNQDRIQSKSNSDPDPIGFRSNYSRNQIES